MRGPVNGQGTFTWHSNERIEHIPGRVRNIPAAVDGEPAGVGVIAGPRRVRDRVLEKRSILTTKGRIVTQCITHLYVASCVTLLYVAICVTHLYVTNSVTYIDVTSSVVTQS